MGKRKIAAVVAVCAILLTLFSGCRGEKRFGGTIHLIYADVNREDIPAVMAARYFSELVRERSNGRILIEVYDGGRLGNEDSVLQQVQLGVVDFSRITMPTLEVYSNQFLILQFPYLIRDADHLRRVLHGSVGQEMMAEAETLGVVGLAWMNGGARNFYIDDHEITSPEALKNERLRIRWDNLSIELMKGLGVHPDFSSFEDVPAAIRTDLIDGSENDFTTYVSAKHYEEARYCVEDEHCWNIGLVIISRKTMKKLSPEDWQMIRECAIEAEAYEWESYPVAKLRAEKKLLESGVKIKRLTKEERNEYRKAAQGVYDAYGGDYADIIHEIRKS